MKNSYWFLLLLLTIVSIVCAIACGSSSSSGDDDDATGDDDVSPADDDDDNASATWVDSSSGLMWQVTPSTTAMLLADAQTYCSGLTLGGFSGWRVPDVDAVRTLIRGCAATATGGACGVTDKCLDSTSSCDNGACAGCTKGGGSAGGCYWPSQLAGACTVKNYWSSSIVADYTIAAWAVDFSAGAVDLTDIHGPVFVRCVR